MDALPSVVHGHQMKGGENEWQKTLTNPCPAQVASLMESPERPKHPQPRSKKVAISGASLAKTTVNSRN